MQLIITIIASVILITGVIVNHRLKLQENTLGLETSQPESITETITPSTSPFPTLSPTPAINPRVTNIPQPTQFIRPTTSPNSASNLLRDFIYPGSKIINQSANAIGLESSDNPDTITDWYKNKINSYSLNVTSFVTTNTNDNINNKLVGESSSRKISVSITKTQSTPYVSITLSN